MISSFSEIFVQYGTLLTTIVFCGFFSISLVALVFRDHEMVRQFYVVFLLCLVLGSSLTGLQPIPIVNAHEYSSVASEQYTHYDLRVVDTEGRELPYDPRAVRPAIQVEELAAIMAQGKGSNQTQVVYTSSQRREMAAFLLRSARGYRRGLDAGQEPLVALVSALKFPPHHLRGHWTAKELSEFSRFVAIRVYRIEVTFAENGRRAVTGDETLVYEYRRGGNETT